jgi:hypothetical protein
MKHFLSVIALFALFALFPPPLQAEGLSGTWTAGSGSSARTFVFKVLGDRFNGIVCGPCDDPAAVFRIEDGRLLDGERVTFFIRYDVGGPLFGQYGPYRDHVTATRSGNQLTLRAQREGETENPVTTVLKRVVDTYAGVDVVAPSGPIAVSPPGAPSKPAPIDGKWVAAGRVSQQNFILKVRDNKVWGLVCGPCNPDGVFMIDDGTFDGNAMTFYINHLDTPPSARRTGVNRNIMRGTLVGNVMKFKWVREGAENEPGGEMVLIGPIR